MSNATSRPVSIPCCDKTLEGRLFLPDGTPELAVLINPATAVPQSFYAAFANWLCLEKKAAVLTYDYRDFAASLDAHTPQSSLTSMADWGTIDQGTALCFLTEQIPQTPIWVIGHSLGGLFLPWHEKASDVSRLITVGSGLAHLRHHPLSFLPLALWFWYVGGPIATLLMGYLPGRSMGFDHNLPAHVFWQWRRWCTTKGFYQIDWGKTLPMPDFNRVKASISVIALSDDPMVPPPCVQEFASFYAQHDRTYQEITPADAKVTKLGHIRVFSETCKAAWPLIIKD